MRHVKSRLLRRVGVVRGPAHGHQGVAGMRVVEVDGGQQRERPGRAQGVAGRVARFVCKRVQPHQAPGWRDVFEHPFAPHLRAVGALHAEVKAAAGPQVHGGLRHGDAGRPEPLLEQFNIGPQREHALTRHGKDLRDDEVGGHGGSFCGDGLSVWQGVF